jgi:hypothetical protein
LDIDQILGQFARRWWAAASTLHPSAGHVRSVVLRALFDVKLHSAAFVQCSKAFAKNRIVMLEPIGSAVLAIDKSESLRVAKSLHLSRHLVPFAGQSLDQLTGRAPAKGGQGP